MLLSSHRSVSVSDIRGILIDTPAVGSRRHKLSQIVDKLLCIWIWVKMVREKQDLFFCILNTQDFSDRQCHYAWQTFFLQNVCIYPLTSACSWASQALIMFLSQNSCFAVWSRLLWTAVPPLKQPLSLWPGVWWHCDPHSQSFTQHHWPSSTSYTTHTSLQVSLCPVTALGIRISGV